MRCWNQNHHQQIIIIVHFSDLIDHALAHRYILNIVISLSFAALVVVVVRVFFTTHYFRVWVLDIVHMDWDAIILLPISRRDTKRKRRRCGSFVLSHNLNPLLRYLDIFEYKMPTNVHLPNLILGHFTKSL